MILVKTKLGQSKVEGVGLFADELIPKDTKTWEYKSEFDTAFVEDDLGKMSEAAREQFIKYTFFDPEQKKYILCFDDQRFINHSSHSFNIKSHPYYDIAIRDIQPGEELLCDYRDFEEGYFERRGIDESTLR